MLVKLMQQFSYVLCKVKQMITYFTLITGCIRNNEHLGTMVTQCYNSESLLAAEKLLDSAKCAIKAINRTAPFVQVQPHEPSNKNIVRQCSFYSTKKRRKKALIRIAKPTHEEKKEIRSALLQRTLLYKGRKEMQGKLKSEFICTVDPR